LTAARAGEAALPYQRRADKGMTIIRVLTLYERIGGEETVNRLVESFYSRMDSLAEAQAIRAMHGADLAPTKAALKQYLTEWLGGPKLYSSEKGSPKLRKRHMHVAIGEAERDAWLLCMRETMNEVIADAQARHQIYLSIEKLADWMRNTAGNPHDTSGSHP
jgi:hemoglobin